MSFEYNYATWVWAEKKSMCNEIFLNENPLILQKLRRSGMDGWRSVSSISFKKKRKRARFHTAVGLLSLVKCYLIHYRKV